MEDNLDEEEFLDLVKLPVAGDGDGDARVEFMYCDCVLAVERRGGIYEE